jgi:hypothetical protein
MRLWRVGLCRLMCSFSDDGWPRRAEPGLAARGVRAEPVSSLPPSARGVAAGIREAARGPRR